MAKTITQLPDATTVGASDEMIIQQSGITKRATINELKTQVAALGANDITISGANRSITNTGNFALSFGTNNTERIRIDASGNVGIGITPDCKFHVYNSGAQTVKFTQEAGATRALFGNQNGAGANKPAVIQSANGILYFGYGNSWSGDGGTITNCAIVKPTGQVRFVPLSSDPSDAESGDVYYNSSSNKLKVYNGTSWVDLH
jgi:hypothetical protein